MTDRSSGKGTLLSQHGAAAKAEDHGGYGADKEDLQKALGIQSADTIR